MRQFILVVIVVFIEACHYSKPIVSMKNVWLVPVGFGKSSRLFINLNEGQYKVYYRSKYVKDSIELHAYGDFYVNEDSISRFLTFKDSFHSSNSFNIKLRPVISKIRHDTDSVFFYVNVSRFNPLNLKIHFINLSDSVFNQTFQIRKEKMVLSLKTESFNYLIVEYEAFNDSKRKICSEKIIFDNLITKDINLDISSNYRGVESAPFSLNLTGDTLFLKNRNSAVLSITNLFKGDMCFEIYNEKKLRKRIPELILSTKH